MSDKLAPSERHRFLSNGQLVYEWDQTLTDVNLYVPVPPGTKGCDLLCVIEPGRLRIGLKSNSPYLSEALCDRVVVAESVWTLEDDVLNVSLQKQREGETWKGVFAGHVLRADVLEADRKRLLLERFQTEHSGFDFSGAEVVGETPNARTFMKDVDP